MDNGTKKNDRGDQVEGFLPDSVCQNGGNTLNIGIFIAVKTARKRLGADSGLVCGDRPCPAQQTDAEYAQKNNGPPLAISLP